MDGTMLCGLRRYLEAEYGEETWEAVLSSAAVPRQLFVPVTEYPDEYFYELVETAAAVTDRPRAAVERDLGRHLADQLTDGEPAGGDRLDVLAGVDSWASPALDGGDGCALTGRRLDDYRVRLTYDCPRGLCEVVHGLVDAVATGGPGDLVVEETECMHDGDARCTFMATAVGTAGSRAGSLSPGAHEATD